MTSIKNNYLLTTVEENREQDWSAALAQTGTQSTGHTAGA